MMHRRDLLLGAGAIGGLAATKTFACGAQHPSFGAPRTRGRAQPAAMLSFHGMPAVAVMIEGKGPFTFGIDTGSPGHFMVTKEVASAAGLTVAGQIQTSDPSGNNPVTISRFKLREAAFGGLTFLATQADELPPLGAPGGDLQGIIGMDLFDGQSLVLDFKSRLVSVSSERLAPADGQTIFDYPAGELIQLPVKIGDVTIPAHLDTGQTNTAMMAPADVIPRLATHGQPRLVGKARTVSQTMEIFAVALDAPVSLGAVRFPVTEVVYPTVIPIGNLGSAALQQMVVKIDRPSRRVQFVDKAGPSAV
jgi:hypothetical protein